jgi:hypothetical protein
MELFEYPKKIAEVQTEIHKFDVEINSLQKNIKLVELEVDTEVSFDATLTNESKRKFRRNFLLDAHPHYWEYAETLEKLKNRREIVIISLCKLQSEFSVAKLEYREKIAKLEMQALFN